MLFWYQRGIQCPPFDPLDPRRTHLSDALGYMISAGFGMRAKAGEMHGFIG